MSKKKWFHGLGSLLGAALFVLALWVLHRELAILELHQIVAGFKAIPSSRIAWAVGLTVLAYLVLTGYDLLGIRYIGKRLGSGRIMFASFLSYVFSNNVGLSIVGASAVRFRIYTARGLSSVAVVELVAFASLSSWLGILALAGAVFTVHPMLLSGEWNIHFLSSRLLGVIFLALVAGYLVICSFRKRPLRIRSWQFALHRTRLAAAQPMVGGLDWLLAAATFYVLLPAGAVPGLSVFLGIYLVAQVTAMLSHVPGGVGVFESIVLVLLKPYVPADAVMGAILGYRAIYYLAPFLAGLLLMGGYEIRRHRDWIKKAGDLYIQRIGAIVPHIFAFAVYLAGSLLLFSGALPALPERIQWLSRLLPVPAMELAHILGSVAGMGLVVVARGLQRRLDGPTGPPWPCCRPVPSFRF